MSRNIFPERSQVAERVLADGDVRRILIVPIDFAEETHVVQIIRGTGEYLRSKPLSVRNSVAGSRYLIEAVENCCARYRISKSRVLFTEHGVSVRMGSAQLKVPMCSSLCLYRV